MKQLDDFLMSDFVPDESMDISMMDGFITAVASGPNLMMPSALLPWIWDAENGVEQPMFENTTQAQSIIGLIMRYWNDINDTLNHAIIEAHQIKGLKWVASGQSSMPLESFTRRFAVCPRFRIIYCRFPALMCRGKDTSSVPF